MNPETNQTTNEHTVQDASVTNSRVTRILYATDLTDSAPRVYQYVLYLAQQFNAEIVCLHVIDTYSRNAAMTLAMYYLTDEEKKEIITRQRTELLEEMARRNRQAFIRQQFGKENGLYPEQLGLKIEDKVVFGNVEEQILKQSVDSNCDLVVMGAHEKPFFTFTPSLSKRVMKRSQVPVTVVPIAGEREEKSGGILPSFAPQFSAARSK